MLNVFKMFSFFSLVVSYLTLIHFFSLSLFGTKVKFKFSILPAVEPVYFSLNRSLACTPWTTSLTEALLQSCKVSCLFSIYRLLSLFDFYRLELNGEPLNCPVDWNILIRDKVSDLLHCQSSHHVALKLARRSGS